MGSLRHFPREYGARSDTFALSSLAGDDNRISPISAPGLDLKSGKPSLREHAHDCTCKSDPVKQTQMAAVQPDPGARQSIWRPRRKSVKKRNDNSAIQDNSISSQLSPAPMFFGEIPAAEPSSNDFNFSTRARKHSFGAADTAKHQFTMPGVQAAMSSAASLVEHPAEKSGSILRFPRRKKPPEQAKGNNDPQQTDNAELYPAPSSGPVEMTSRGTQVARDSGFSEFVEGAEPRTRRLTAGRRLLSLLTARDSPPTTTRGGKKKKKGKGQMQEDAAAVSRTSAPAQPPQRGRAWTPAMALYVPEARTGSPSTNKKHPTGVLKKPGSQLATMQAAMQSSPSLARTKKVSFVLPFTRKRNHSTGNAESAGAPAVYASAAMEPPPPVNSIKKKTSGIMNFLRHRTSTRKDDARMDHPSPRQDPLARDLNTSSQIGSNTQITRPFRQGERSLPGTQRPTAQIDISSENLGLVFAAWHWDPRN
ncbi:hypothetical protein B0H15DRAFT_991776 [Mycena belliarum]|uniref:Uncharacterized protein n=1 Tax=Mycena belliarum TaxID=1033014 RepID=A0AAD6U2M0_9AGAR|nr:hypothetical protein B0H15DRAFT_991776 [Mycena belliae]